MTLKASKGRQDLLLFVLCLFTATFFVYRDFDIRMIYGYAVLGMVLGVHGLRRLWQDRAPALDPMRLAFLVLSLVVFVNFLRPDSRHDADSVSFVISMLICCAFVVLSHPGEGSAKAGLLACFLSAVAMTVFVLFFEANPWFFWNWFLEKLSDTAASYLCYYVPKGYGFTLGGCTYTNYMLFIGIAICCAYAACGRKFDWKSILALAIGGVFFYAIILVGRRGELLGAAICLGLLAIALCTRKQRRFLILGGAIALVAGFAAVVVLLPWLKQIPAMTRYVMTIEKLLKGQDITSGRLELYALAFDAFLDRPLFGIGWDQFHTLIPQSFLNAHGQDVEDVHCIYLQFFTEAGIVGAPLLIAPMVYGYWLVCRQLSRLKERPELTTARMLCICSFMVQSFLLVLGIYDPNFQRVIFWCFHALAIMMMLGAMELEGHTPDDRLSRLLSKFIRFCAPPFALVWGWVAGLFSKLRRNSPEKK